MFFYTVLNIFCLISRISLDPLIWTLCVQHSIQYIIHTPHLTRLYHKFHKYYRSSLCKRLVQSLNHWYLSKWSGYWLLKFLWLWWASQINIGSINSNLQSYKIKFLNHWNLNTKLACFTYRKKLPKKWKEFLMTLMGELIMKLSTRCHTLKQLSMKTWGSVPLLLGNKQVYRLADKYNNDNYRIQKSSNRIDPTKMM